MPLKILQMSDLHLERYKDYGESFVKSLRAEADVVILAGDILSLKRGLDPLKFFYEKYEHVVWVLGNHEFYGSEPRSILQGLRSALHFHPQVSLLNKDTVEIKGQRFVGTTLWYKDSVFNKIHISSFSDGWWIPNVDPWVWEENKAAEEYLKKEVRAGDIVISHHAPSYGSIAPQWQGDPYNSFYVCDMEETIAKAQPKIWFHGHMHSSFNYTLGDTRIICNPRGYIRAGNLENPYFNESLVIDV